LVPYLIDDFITAKIGDQFTKWQVLQLGTKTLRIEHEINRNAGFTKAHDRMPEYFYHEINDSSQTVLFLKRI